MAEVEVSKALVAGGPRLTYSPLIPFSRITLPQRVISFWR
jgi:hypothetical protein